MEEEDDYIEQLAAQIAIFSCEVPRAAIKEGRRLAYLQLLKKPKTKYEYNNERKRDIPKVAKKAQEVLYCIVLHFMYFA
jgi:hypothetical protein